MEQPKAARTDDGNVAPAGCVIAVVSQSTELVARALRKAGIESEILEMPDSTRTAEEAAAAVGCEVSQIVKSLVFRTEADVPVLVLVSGANRVDERRLAVVVGAALERAGAGFVRERTGFAIGGVPPLGHDHPLATYFDEDLLEHPVVWAAGGTPRSVFAAEPAELVRATGAVVIDIAG
jgi:prolyl-tRNA editing enzyme YbaK/EbsC (Cys-tRNA(Pro) deacylase)